MVHLAADESTGIGVVRVPLQRNDASLFNVDDQAAGVGAVKGTDGEMFFVTGHVAEDILSGSRIAYPGGLDCDPGHTMVFSVCAAYSRLNLQGDFIAFQ